MAKGNSMVKFRNTNTRKIIARQRKFLCRQKTCHPLPFNYILPSAKCFIHYELRITNCELRIRSINPNQQFSLLFSQSSFVLNMNFTIPCYTHTKRINRAAPPPPKGTDYEIS